MIEKDRIAAAELQLLRLGLHTSDPRWSSAILDSIIQTVMTTPGGTIGDLLNAALRVLVDYRPEMSDAVANLLKDLVVKSFTMEPKSYEAVHWPTFIQAINVTATEPLLYFAMHAVPEQYMNDELAHRILSGLKRTRYEAEAARLLAA